MRLRLGVAGDLELGDLALLRPELPPPEGLHDDVDPEDHDEEADQREQDAEAGRHRQGHRHPDHTEYDVENAGENAACFYGHVGTSCR